MTAETIEDLLALLLCPALTVGVGQRRVHQPEGWIDLADFERVCALAVEMATGDVPVEK